MANRPHLSISRLRNVSRWQTSTFLHIFFSLAKKFVIPLFGLIWRSEIVKFRSELTYCRYLVHMCDIIWFDVGIYLLIAEWYCVDDLSKLRVVKIIIIRAMAKTFSSGSSNFRDFMCNSKFVRRISRRR